MREEVESAAAQLVDRAQLEAEYRAAVLGEVGDFLDHLAVRASRRDPVMIGTALALWAAMVQRLSGVLPAGSAVIPALAESTLPSIAASSALSAVSTAPSALGPTALAAQVRAALGLDTGADGEGKIGSVAHEDGGRSWQAEAEAAARTAATADLAADTITLLREQGYTHKRWSTRFDSRVRDTHAAVDQLTIPLDAEFQVGGASLRYPADPLTSDVGETVNCRCVLVGVKYGQRPLDHPEGTSPWNNARPF